MSSLAQTSLTSGNIANTIAEYITTISRPLVDFIEAQRIEEYVWFTGSRVWAWTVPPGAWGPPSLYTDLDIMVAPLHKGVCILSDIFKKFNGFSYNGQCGKYAPVIGDKYTLITDSLISINVDVWQQPNVIDGLAMYPEASHSHCRAAFSFKYGLIIQPNTNGWS